MKAKLLLPVLRVLLAAAAMALVSCSGTGAYKQADNNSMRAVDPFPFHHFNRMHHNHCSPL
jgi:hypothetical protein